jgi:glycosyltransferase involved in cell wall biosynthesis
MRHVLLIDHHQDLLGGGQMSLLALAQALPRTRPIIVCGGPGALSQAAASVAPVHHVPMPPLRPRHLAGCVRAVFALARLARTHAPSVLHANSSRAMAYAAVAGRLAGRPTLWHVRVTGSDPPWDALLRRAASRVIAVSGAVAARFPTTGRVRTIYNGVDVDRFRAGDAAAWRRRLGLGPGPVVGMVAQLLPWKRYPDFLRAVAMLAAPWPEAQFVVAGADPDPARRHESQLRGLAKELGLDRRLQFLGFCGDVPGLMHLLDIFVLTSDGEPFGRVVIEAMAAARPVVATAAGGIPEIVLPGVTGLLVPVAQVAELAAAIGQLLADPLLAQAMGAAGRQRAMAHFSLDAHARAVEALYDELWGDDRVAFPAGAEPGPRPPWRPPGEGSG